MSRTLKSYCRLTTNLMHLVQPDFQLHPTSQRLLPGSGTQSPHVGSGFLITPE